MTIIGKDVAISALVELSDAERHQGTYIIGKTGSGKSTLLRSMIQQDVHRGAGVLVLDPHGDLIAEVLERVPETRAKDVCILDPRAADWPFSINPFWCPEGSPPETKGRIAGQFVELIEKLWGAQGTEGTSWGPNIPMILRNIALVFIESRELTMLEIRRFLTDADFRKAALKNVDNDYTLEFWSDYDRMNRMEQRNLTSSTLNKLDEFLSQGVIANIVGQSGPPLNVRELMDTGKIVVVPLGLGRLGHNVVSLLGSLIVLQVLNAALAREEIAPEDRKTFFLYADEFQRFSTPAFSTLLTEARKYRVAPTIAHQTRGQLDEHNRDAALNAANLVVFAVHGDDAEELAKQFQRRHVIEESTQHRQHLAITREPVQFLARNGHVDPEIRKIVEKILIPLTNAAETPEGLLWQNRPYEEWKPIFFDDGAYYASRTTCRDGVAMINSYLVKAMEDARDDSFDDFFDELIVTDAVEEFIDGLVAILLRLRAFLGFAPFEEPALAGPSGDYSPERRTPVRQVAWIPDLGEDWIKAVIVEILRGADPIPRVGRFAMLRQYFWDTHLERLMGWDDKDFRHKYAFERAHLEGSALLEAVRGLVQLADKLRTSPILVPTGQWEDLPERPRTYADLEGEIANRLVSLPQFRAFCRIQRDGRPLEFEINTPTWGDLQVLDEAHNFALPETLREQSRGLYCRPRAVVEEEIRRRSRGDDDPPARARAVPVE